MIRKQCVDVNANFPPTVCIVCKLQRVTVVHRFIFLNPVRRDHYAQGFSEAYNIIDICVKTVPV